MRFTVRRVVRLKQGLLIDTRANTMYRDINNIQVMAVVVVVVESRFSL